MAAIRYELSMKRRCAAGLAAAAFGLIGASALQTAAAVDAPPASSVVTAESEAAPLFEAEAKIVVDGQVVDGRADDAAAAARWQSQFYARQVEAKSGDPFGAAARLRSGAGETFTLVAARGDERWQLDGRFKPLADGTIELTSDLKYNGNLISHPYAIVRDGHSATVEQNPGQVDGKNPATRSKAFMLTLVVHRVATDTHAEPVVATDAAPAEIPRSRMLQPPRYPAEAARAGVQGEAQVSVAVDARGVPTSAEAVEVEPAYAADLGGAAAAAALQWRYKPALRNGSPVAGTITTPVKFRLAGSNGFLPMAAPNPSRAQAASYRRISAPVYPAHALSEKIAGKVFVRCQLAADGRLVTARVEQVVAPVEASELGEAALEAVQAWQFNPALANGSAVASDVRVPVEFRLSGAAPIASAEAEAALPAVSATLQDIVVGAP